MKTNMVTFDTDELEQKAKDAGLNMSELSLMAGMSRDYLSHSMRMGLINLNVLTKIYEILGKRPKASKPDRKTRITKRHLSRERLTIGGAHCREVIESKGWHIKDVADQLDVTGSAVATWLRKDYIPENIIEEFAGILGISTEEILTGWPPMSGRQMELDFTEPEEPLYTADEVKAMMRKFVTDLADRIIDYLGEAIDSYGKEGSDGSI